MEWLNNNAFVKSVYKKFKITWGGFNLLKAELFLIKQAVANKEVDYIHVMSAQDYPIRNLKFIKTVFEREVGTEFLSYHRIPFIGWDRGTYNRFEAIVNFCVVKCWISYSFPYFYMHKGL